MTARLAGLYCSPMQDCCSVPLLSHGWRRYITQEELAGLSTYMTQRLSLDKVNSVLMLCVLHSNMDQKF